MLVTAGPTFEAIDPVRGITNLSSGKMGFAIARAAREAGADVTLVAGPVQPAHAARRDAHRREIGARHAATPRNRRPGAPTSSSPRPPWPTGGPRSACEHKIKKDGSGNAPNFAFTENPDILADGRPIAAGPVGALFCVGFAAESHDLAANAQAKRERKGVPLLVGNIGPATFGARRQRAAARRRTAATRELPRAPKLELARALVAEIAPPHQQTVQ